RDWSSDVCSSDLGSRLSDRAWTIAACEWPAARPGSWSGAGSGPVAGIASQAEILAQINIPDFLIGQQGFTTAFGDDRTGAENIGAFTNTECFAHVVIGNQDADAALLQMANDV